MHDIDLRLAEALHQPRKRHHVYRLINQNASAVITLLDQSGDIIEYCQLRRNLISSNEATNDREFQRKYRRYWRMNHARLGGSFYARYFGLLNECWRQKRVDIGEIARAISNAGGANHGLQFSFATKLANMMDPCVPVYDSFVAGFYFYVAPASHRPFEYRLTNLLAFHTFLKGEYARVLQLGLLHDAIRQFRNSRSIDDFIPDERIVDWLLWTWVLLLRKGARYRGEALYE